MVCESGPESPMQRCQMAGRDHQKIPQSNLKINYEGHFLFWSKVWCSLKQVMNLYKSCHAYLAKITPHHGKSVFSFSHLLVFCAILFYALVFPLCFPIWQLPLSVSFPIRKRVEMEGFPWVYGGQQGHPLKFFLLASR